MGKFGVQDAFITRMIVSKHRFEICDSRFFFRSSVKCKLQGASNFGGDLQYYCHLSLDLVNIKMSSLQVRVFDQ